MSTQKSIRLTDASVKVINEVSPVANFNGSINSIIERYRRMCTDSLPELSDSEKKLIANIYRNKNYDLKKAHITAKTLPSTIKDAILFVTHDKEYSLNTEDLKIFMAKIDRLTYTECMAIYHFAVGGFWSI